MARVAESQTLGMMLKGDEQLQRAVVAIMRDTKDLRPIWRRFYRQAFYDGMEQTFNTAQSGRWRNNTGRYLRWKRKRSGGHLMTLTGEFRRSLTSQAPGGYFKPQLQQMEIGASPVGEGTWKSPNTPRGRMVIWAGSPWMQREMTEAATEHVAWYGRTWQHGV